MFGAIRLEDSYRVVAALNMKLNRTRLAYTLAPALPALFFLIWLNPFNSAIAIISVLFVSLAVSYSSCFLFGLPLIPYLKRKQRLNIIFISIGGAVLGMVVVYVAGFGVAATLGSTKSVIPELSELLWGAALGLLVALAFGLIAGYPLTGTANGSELEQDTAVSE